MSCKKKVDLCFCEPFILPGVLPTLGVSTLKAALSIKGITSYIFYPSLKFFVENKLYEDHELLSIIENTPLQLVEFLFVNNNYNNALNYIINNINDTLNKERRINQLISLKEKCEILLNELAESIVQMDPKIFCYSLTFGDFNFAFSLFKKLKKLNPKITIMVGGSNCIPEFSKILIDINQYVDFVLCDETGDIFLDVIKSILVGNYNISDNIYLSSRNHIAVCVNTIRNLDLLPCPDFDDYIDTVESLNMCRPKITLPYEISRGCWWGEKKPCTMCGFFGNQQCFLIKSKGKVINELTYLSKKYNIFNFRFSDLVQPNKEYLYDLLPIAKNKFRLFWELRPNLSKSEIVLLRKLGLTYAQIGIESLSTEQLRYINKGTTGINNIYMLINFSTYKISVIWNYLYGFKDDKQSWYEDIIKIMPMLYHLQPPVAREVWLNRYSYMFNEMKIKLQPIGDNTFHQNLPDDFNVFFKMPKNLKMFKIYDKLNSSIQEWQIAFNNNYSLYIDDIESDSLHIVRDYEEKRHFEFNDLEAEIYMFFMEPNTVDEAVKYIHVSKKRIELALNMFLKLNLMIYLDEKYLSLATSSSKYKWTKYYEQVSYSGKKLFL